MVLFKLNTSKHQRKSDVAAVANAIAQCAWSINMRWPYKTTVVYICIINILTFNFINDIHLIFFQRREKLHKKKKKNRTHSLIRWGGRCFDFTWIFNNKSFCRSLPEALTLEYIRSGQVGRKKDGFSLARQGSTGTLTVGSLPKPWFCYKTIRPQIRHIFVIVPWVV